MLQTHTPLTFWLIPKHTSACYPTISCQVTVCTPPSHVLDCVPYAQEVFCCHVLCALTSVLSHVPSALRKCFSVLPIF